METKGYTNVDKSEWKDGPWKNEPDKVQWQDEVTGYPCLIVRNRVGALCGYVGVGPSHPWYKQNYNKPFAEGGYDASPEGMIDVHGGLTFSDGCQPSEDETKGICHVPGEGEPDKVWWFGFDCAHAGDVTPKLLEFLDFSMLSGHEVYRDMAYVKEEVRKLAEQLKAKEVA